MSDSKSPAKPKPSTKKLSARAAKAIFDISEEIGVLIRHDRNGFAKYNFVGIDQFYELVATTARKHGINWNFDEDGRPEPINNGESVLVTYRVNLWWTEGDTIEHYPAHRMVTVLHPLNGPQTFMSMESYAQKIFMRSLFKVSTGEPDADSIDPNTRMMSGSRKRFNQPIPLREVKNTNIISAHEEGSIRATVSGDRNDPQDPGRFDGDPGWQPDDLRSEGPPPPEPPSLPLEDIMGPEAKAAQTIDELNERWRSHMMDLKALQDREPARFARIKTMFANRKVDLLKKGSRVITDQFPRRSAPPSRRRDSRAD